MPRQCIKGPSILYKYPRNKLFFKNNAKMSLSISIAGAIWNKWIWNEMRFSTAKKCISVYNTFSAYMFGSSGAASVKSMLERLREFRIRNDLWRCALAEFVGTVIFVWIGTSTSAQALLSRGRANEHVAVAFGWGFALTFGVQMTFRISGGHLNPAISLFAFTLCQLDVRRLVVYWSAQTAGAFIGAAFTFLAYYDAIGELDGGERYVTGPFQTARIFATYPSDHLSTAGAFVDQILGTMLLCILIATTTERRNRVPDHVQPLLIGIGLVLVGVSFGFNCGGAVNPARDLGPRLFTLVAGYGWRVFSYRGYRWFWVPVVGPLVGGVLGGWLYHLLIGIHIPSELDDLEEKVLQMQFDNNQGSRLYDHSTHVVAIGSEGDHIRHQQEQYQVIPN